MFGLLEFQEFLIKWIKQFPLSHLNKAKKCAKLEKILVELVWYRYFDVVLLLLIFSGSVKDV